MSNRDSGALDDGAGSDGRKLLVDVGVHHVTEGRSSDLGQVIQSLLLLPKRANT